MLKIHKLNPCKKNMHGKDYLYSIWQEVTCLDCLRKLSRDTTMKHGIMIICKTRYDQFRQFRNIHKLENPKAVSKRGAYYP